MKHKISLPLMVGLASVVLLLISCGTPVENPNTTQVPTITTCTPLPPPISPEFPTGMFFHEHEGGTFCVWLFNDDGTYEYFYNTQSIDVSSRTPYVTGTYTVSGNLYTETGDSLCSIPATYTWTYDGHTLTFQVVGEDKCADRQRTYESSLKYTKAE